MNMQHVLLGLVCLSIFLLYGNSRWDLPVLTIINRWLRWIIFSFAAAHLIQHLEREYDEHV